MIGFLILAVTIFLGWCYVPGRRKHLPPGPVALPLIGNPGLLVPRKEPWKFYDGLIAKYGPIVHLKYGQQTVILLGSHTSAKDLLDKRSRLYSSRPRLLAAGTWYSQGLHLTLMPYAEQWIKMNRVGSSIINDSAPRWQTVLDLESIQLVHDLMHDSTIPFADHFSRYATSSMFCLSYGRRVRNYNGDEEQERNFFGRQFLRLALGFHIADMWPGLNILPAFLAGWKSSSEQLRQMEDKTYLKWMEEGLTRSAWNFCKAALLSNSSSLPLEQLGHLVGTYFVAGSTSTAVLLQSCVYAALVNPAALRKAQGELDQVVGSSRFPTFKDIPSLPYIRAFVQEVLRWRPTSTSSLPHSVTDDDQYMGYQIPKGSTIIVNEWTLRLDKEVFPSPQDFLPERWLDHKSLPAIAFGYGKRACPGKYLGNDAVLIGAARLFWAYTMEGAAGESFEGRSPTYGVTLGFPSPTPFNASFYIRGPERAQAIEDAFLARVSGRDAFNLPMDTV